MSNTLLTEARTALHALMTGKQIVSITDQNGERVDFTRAKISELKAYIAALEAGGSVAPTGPLRFVF